MSSPHNTPNFTLVRSLNISGFVADTSPLSSAPAAADIYVGPKSGGEWDENAKGKTMFFNVANGGTIDTAAKVTFTTWVRSTIVPDTAGAVSTTWSVAAASQQLQAYTYLTIPFRGDMFIQVTAVQTTLSSGTISLYASSSLAGEGNPATAVVSSDTVTAKFGFNATDAFGRLRVSEPQGLFDGKFLYDKNPLIYDELISGGASSSGPGTTAMVNMSTAANNDRIVRQSRRYVPYQPGKSYLVYMTGVLNASGLATGSRARLGVFDDSSDKTFSGSATGGNGFFIQQNGPTLCMVKRSFVSGTQVDTEVPRDQWNTDTLDGAGPSGVTLDVSKNNIYWWDFEWLGAGTIRQGVVVDGAYVTAHVWNNANLINTMYSQTMTLPVRYELAQTAAGVSFLMKQGCAMIASEGGHNPRGLVFSADRDIRTRTVSTTLLPLLTVRLRKEQNRGSILPLAFDVTTTSATVNVRYALIYGVANQNPVNLLGATFAGVSGSMAEYDIIASGMTGGYLIESGYLVAGTAGGGTRNAQVEVTNDMVLAASIIGQPDTVTLAAQTDSSNGAMYASLKWQEYY